MTRTTHETGTDVLPVSRLYAHSKNYDMDLTLDYNVELFALEDNQTFALALASSLARGPPTTNEAGEEEKDTDVWRPDGKGRRGLEEDYDYVMYGKVRLFRFLLTTLMLSFVQVYRFEGSETAYVTAPCKLFPVPHLNLPQDCIRIIWWPSYVPDRIVQAHVEHCTRRPAVHLVAQVTASPMFSPIIVAIDAIHSNTSVGLEFGGILVIVAPT